MGILKDDVRERVFLLDILLNLDIQVVAGVLRFPIAMGKLEHILERAVRINVLLLADGLELLRGHAFVIIDARRFW